MGEETSLLALGAAIFALAGFVKGTLGIGLGLVAVPVLSLILPSHRAIAMMVVPVLLSNAWQTWETGVPARELRRFAPLVLALVASAFVTVRLTLGLPERVLGQMIAAVVLIAIGLMVWQPTLNVPPRSEGRWSLAVGGLSGMMGGISAMTGPLIITYLMALRLPRETFVGCMSMIYLCSAIPLYSTMLWYGRIGTSELLLSALALVPMWCGLRIGRACRARLGENRFRHLLLAVLAMVAVALIVRSL